MIMGNMAVFARSLHLGRFAFAAMFLFLMVGMSWGACTERRCSYTDRYYCNTYYSLSDLGDGRVCIVTTSTNDCNRTCGYTGIFIDATGCTDPNIYTYITCDTQCEADSIQCVNDGYEWGAIAGGTCGGKGCLTCDEQCQCEEQGMIWTGTECIEDTTLCNPYRSQCAGLGGEFIGEVKSVNGERCCVASCNTCGTSAMKRVQDLKISSCCARGQYADSTVMCYTNYLREGCGMAFSSNIPQDDKESFCRDPNLDDEAASIYAQQCSVEQSSSSIEPGGGSSSSEGGGTSSEGGNSSGGEYGDCQECPWLDSILDTLHSTHSTIDDIMTCMQVPGACPGFDFSVDFSEMPVFGFDTAFRKYLKPLMDSTLKVDSLQLKALLKLDTNQLKLLKADSASLKNDTVTWTKFDALGNVIDTSVHSYNDTTRKWFKRIADSIGVSTDSLAAHIDSIVRHIPDSVLDSIVKYQQYASDNFDSVLFGTGKGFSLVDSLIDSSVKYFKESNQKWNEYISMYGDSMQKIHEEFVDLPGRNASAIGSALGYGDTASTNLRGDLNGIREAIENGFGSLDSGWGEGTSPSDTVGDGPYTGYEDGSDSVGNAYLKTLGGLLDSAINDTSFGTIFAPGEDTANWDSSARLPSVDSMKAHLDSSIVTQRSEVEDSLQAAFDTLKDEFMLLNYDSLILAPLGMRIPNSNTCPEHCFTFSIEGGEGNMSWMGGVGVLDFGLCKPLPGFRFNVLYLIRIIGRMFTAVFCIYIGLWFIAGRKQ